MITLNTPLKTEDLIKLNAGDEVLLNGTIFTARDKAHLFLLEEDFAPVHNGIIYHAGPIINEKNEVISAGPTTSARMNPYTPKLIEKYGLKAIIGKGGMSDEVISALAGKAVYFSAIGGLGVTYAKAMKFKNLYQPEFGMPEAIWEFEVKDFPVIVAIDAKGDTLYGEIKENSTKKFSELTGLM